MKVFIIIRGKNSNPTHPVWVVHPIPVTNVMLPLLVQFHLLCLHICRGHLKKWLIFGNDIYLCYSELGLYHKICEIQLRRYWDSLVIANFTQVFCQTHDRASQCDCDILERLPQIILFLFKVLLCLVAMHFTVNSSSFEILSLFIVSLLWEAALLLSYAAYFCFKAN